MTAEPTRDEAKHDALVFGVLTITLLWGFALCITQPQPWTAEAIVLAVLTVLSMRCWARARRYWKRSAL